MSTTITAPTSYSTVKKPVIFGIYRSIDSPFEVTINGYKKLLPQGARSVNIASYYLADFAIGPAVEQSDEYVIHAGYQEDRVTQAQITIDGVVSALVPLICADQLPKAGRFMSDLRRRVIARGQVDEIPVYLADSAHLYWGIHKILLPEGLSFVTIRIPDDTSEKFSIVLRDIDAGETELDRIEYQVEAANVVRMAWINSYGAIDFWNFISKRKAQLKVSREKIYSNLGYTSTSIQGETLHTVTTQNLPRQTLEALSWLFMTEQAWVVDNAQISAIDIITEKSTIYDAEKPGALQVEYRNRIRQL